ncbi:outer membrane protein assembly factor BamB family protein [Flavihumibacter petaseus]|uniref:Pyrrolo-quinoline quinone repeat domain-containing protein n=1 Tax=Flavihumibacter petaseus NBRC 106054 TaxID=1220578 RepID=A0A0E9N5D0_9BACT|nr:PQQ-binding-like beta-propeller repeat protein [Flavihumibacter petaseus]GAO45182.1 hypothetical protein FPE01S_04_04260 [Flavihumibacter petaseus NBRC 106054]
MFALLLCACLTAVSTATIPRTATASLDKIVSRDGGSVANCPGDPRPLTAIWTFSTGGKILGNISSTGDTVLVGSTDGYLYALSAASGSLFWKYNAGTSIQSEPLATDNAFFVYSSDGVLHRIRTDGSGEWKVSLCNEKEIDTWDYYRSSPVVWGNNLLIGCGNGKVYALNKRNGQQRWAMPTGAPIHMKGLLKGGTFYVGNFGGRLFAMDPATGKTKWTFKAIGNQYFKEGAFQQTPAIAGDVLYIGSRDYNFYAVDAKAGHGVWNFREKDSWFIATPLLHAGKVFTGTSDSHRFVAFDAANGEVIWSRPFNMRLYGEAVAVDSTIFAGCFNGHLVGMDQRTGEIRFDFETEGSRLNSKEVYGEDGHFRQDFQLYGPDNAAAEAKIMSLGAITGKPLVAGSHLVTGSADGNVYAIRLPSVIQQ